MQGFPWCASGVHLVPTIDLRVYPLAVINQAEGVEAGPEG